MTPAQLKICPDCGEECEWLCEGRCLECHNEGQRTLDAHNAQYDRWQSLTDAQRGEEIRRAY